MARPSPMRSREDDHARPSPLLPPPSPPSPEESTRKWTNSEEAALIAYWREHAEQYTSRTKRFFYDGAALIPALRLKTTAQIKSKCFDIEKRYRNMNMMIGVWGDADSEATRRRVTKKFSLYYDVHPFLSQLLATASTAAVADDAPPMMSTTAASLAATAAAVSAGSSDASPPPAGVRSHVAPPPTGKKRVLLVGGSIPRSPPQQRTGKRHRPEIDRFAIENEAIADAHGTAVRSSANGDARWSDAINGTTSSAPAGSFSAMGAPHIQETAAMVEAATTKLRAEAKLATIRANAALLRERKALLDEGISETEIDALLPLESADC